ncbi:MAG: Hpt domain-containing protein [Candidatus Aminicenantes bacterium]
MTDASYSPETDSPIDYASALERTGGDESLLKELINLYIQDFREKKNPLQKAIKEKNFILIQEIGHSLKGSAANLSLIPLCEASQNLEMSGREKNPQKADKAFLLLQQKIKSLEVFLQEKEHYRLEKRNKHAEKESLFLKTKNEILENSASPTILLGDDSVDTQVLMKKLFSQLNLRLDIASNGQQAVRLFHKKKYALIFLDIHMPEENGFEALKEIRRLEKQRYLSPTPVIALTGTSFSEGKEKGPVSDFDDYVEKPFERNAVMRILRKHLGKSVDISVSKAVTVDESIKDLIPGYLKNREKDVENMNDALNMSDFSKIESLAHKIKGSSESYGFKEIGQIGQQIEKSARENDHAKIRQLLKKMKTYLNNIHYE